MRLTLPVAILFVIPLAAGAQPRGFPLVHDVRAFVTGYNTVPGQTDDTPCIAASLAYICGRTDAVACPRRISLGTYLQIRGAIYVCEDRLAKKFDSRFDISCDKDTNCPSQVTGWCVIRVLPYKRQPLALAGFFGTGKMATAPRRRTSGRTA